MLNKPTNIDSTRAVVVAKLVEQLLPTPGAYPIKILQHKFYAMLIFKHPDWLINLSSQSKCFKN